jgi:P4 family phage/plasmid primase-like protien
MNELNTVGVTRQPPTEAKTPQTLSIARGKAANKGKIERQQTVTLAELGGILRHAQTISAPLAFKEWSALRAAKDAGDKTAVEKLERLKSTNWFTCATFKGTQRDIAHLETCSAIVGDADEPPTTREALIASLDALGCSYILATSTSHGCGGQDRYRVIVPLSKPIEPSRYEAGWTRVHKKLNGMISTDAKDASRLNYMPRTPKGATGHEVIVVDDRPWLDAEVVAPSAENTGKSAAPAERPQPRGYSIEQIREDLRWVAVPADEVSWAAIMRGVCHETRGSEQGLNAIDEWSRSDPATYGGREQIETRWRSPSWHESKTPKTYAEVLQRKVSDPSKFPIGATLIGEVPRAHYPCTDQANANRIKDAYGTKLVAVNGKFYAWTGTHWARDEGAACRYAANLSNLVKIEAKAERQRFDSLAANNPDAIKLRDTKRRDKSCLQDDLLKTPQGPETVKALLKAEKLEKWAVQCEARWVQNAALWLLRDTSTFEADKLDRDPWALNCLNGTVDLRTGKLKAHDPADFITHCIPFKFDSAAKALRFERFLLEIMGNDETHVYFLQRWFGYCATASVREQKIIVHIGGGGNGKGTLLEVIAYVLGEYAMPAAPGLIADSGINERHTTEIAELRGRRMVTASESDAGAVLREAFIKQATGGDTLKGRFMHCDFFSFLPTHKLQLQTNHTPQIISQDFAMWRRILLVKYPLSFGSEEDVIAGKATHLRDMTLPDTLRQESEGILAWIVHGAVEWYCNGGLKPPASVLAAVRDYQDEQDRVREFVRTCCTLDATAWSPFSGVLGLYPSYVRWCKSNGYHSLGKGRFITELARVVGPNFRKEESKGKNRKTVNGAYGLRVDPDDDWPCAPDPASPATDTPDNSDLGGVAS